MVTVIVRKAVVFEGDAFAGLLAHHADPLVQDAPSGFDRTVANIGDNIRVDFERIALAGKWPKAEHAVENSAGSLRAA
jgi:hypothetical protein